MPEISQALTPEVPSKRRTRRAGGSHECGDRRESPLCPDIFWGLQGSLLRRLVDRAAFGKGAIGWSKQIIPVASGSGPDSLGDRAVRSTKSPYMPERSVDMDAADRPADHQALDLARAFKNGVDLRIAVPLLDRVLPDVAVTAEDLNGLLGHPHGVLAGVQLGHGALAVLELLAGAGHVGGPVDQQPCGVGVHLHVGQLERDGLVLDDGPAELLTLLRVLQRVLVGGPG